MAVCKFNAWLLTLWRDLLSPTSWYMEEAGSSWTLLCAYLTRLYGVITQEDHSMILNRSRIDALWVNKLWFRSRLQHGVQRVRHFSIPHRCYMLPLWISFVSHVCWHFIYLCDRILIPNCSWWYFESTGGYFMWFSRFGDTTCNC
jgi:hypothetical protein